MYNFTFDETLHLIDLDKLSLCCAAFCRLIHIFTLEAARSCLWIPQYVRFKILNVIICDYRVQPKHWSSRWCSNLQRHSCRLCRCLMDPHPTAASKWKSSRWEELMREAHRSLKSWAEADLLRCAEDILEKFSYLHVFGDSFCFFICVIANDWGLNLHFLFILSQAVTALVKNFPKPMVSSMQQILPIVWNTLTESAALYPFNPCCILTC